MIKNYIFLGAPGVGKGTLAKVLSKRNGFIHISTGDIFRDNIKNKTELGLKVKNLLENGHYVPDEITNEIVAKRLRENDVKEHGFILDGYPRTINQANFLKDQNLESTTIVLLEAPVEVTHKRLEKRAKLENRKDDAPKTITNRINVYKKQTAPLIEFYTNDRTLVSVDASGNVEENVENLIRELKLND